MSRGISTQQRRIIEILAMRPAGFPRDVLQAQLWPEIFGTDYRFTEKSAEIVKAKGACRVVLSRALASLIRRGLIREGNFERVKAKEIHSFGLKLPYTLINQEGEPHNGNTLGRMLVVATAS